MLKLNIDFKKFYVLELSNIFFGYCTHKSLINFLIIVTNKMAKMFLHLNNSEEDCSNSEKYPVKEEILKVLIITSNGRKVKSNN